MKTQQLNPQQQCAVNHIEGPLLVLAGAGSGKTRIVTQRIAYLLEIGVPAGEILAVTFTNKAAEEMRSRVKDLTDKNVLTSTFHSLGARILRESIHLIGYAQNFTIYDEEDSRLLIKNCLNSSGIKVERGAVKTYKMEISQAKNALLLPGSAELCSEQPLFNDVYALYQERLKSYNALDFDDLLFLTIKLFKNCPDILEAYQKRWSFLLIDEYQDTNYAQYLIANFLVAKHQNLFAVGDPDQSIYSWRGANINNILNFEKDYPGAKVISLEQNYRSTNHILKAANRVISQNGQRMEKELWSDLGDGDKVGVYISENDHEERDFVIKTLLTYQNQEFLPLNNAVIFYRTNSQSRIFEDALLKHQIPYVIIGALSFYQRREIKDFLALMRMVVSDFDFLSFARTVNLPKRGIGPTALKNLRTYCEINNLSIFDLLKKIDEDIELKLSTRQKQGLKEYLGIILHLRKMHQEDSSLSNLFQEALSSSRYLQYLKEDPETYEDRKENIDELISKAAEWEMENYSSSLLAFLEELSLNASHAEDPYASSLRLMTLHNGKGLEFDLVFVVGMEEDLFPHVNSKDTIEELEEERRLCYVGMTRAKKHLYLTASKYRILWGNPRYMQPSRFLSELPREHATFFKEDREEEEFKQDTYIEELEEKTFKLEEPVFHKDFGKGFIKKIYHTSLGLTYDVYFPESRITRSLVAKFAKLSPLATY